MVDVTIDSGRDANHTSRAVVHCEELSEVESISHSASSSYYDKAGKSEVCANLTSLLLHLSSSQLIYASADVIVSTEVDIVLEVFACHDLVFVGYQTVDASNEANKLDVVSLRSISEETINDVVASWCLATHVDKADFLGSGLVNGEHPAIKVIQFSVACILEVNISQEFILDLNKVVRLSVVLEMRELVIHLRSDLSSEWSVLLDS